MDDDNLMDVNFTDLDLNQEPIDPHVFSFARVGTLLNELETAHGSVEERIRQLQGVTARAMQRQRRRQERNSMEISHISNEMVVDADAERGDRDGINNIGVADTTAENGKGRKRDRSYLVAKALGMDSAVKKSDEEEGSFYDCNICLDIAKDPVLTCCGHLFCWACFYQVAGFDSTSKDCPVCKGEVSDGTVIPIYGNGGSEGVCETESGLKIPPRPKARRVEGVRQQRVAFRLPHVPVVEALRQIRISIGAMGQASGGNVNSDMESQEGQNAEPAGSRRLRIHQVSRVLSESSASLSSLSSALSSVERLVEDLGRVINNRFLRNDAQASSPDVGNRLTRHTTVLENQPLESAADLNAALPITSSSQSTDVSGSAVQFLRMRSSGEINLSMAPSYSVRIRNSMSRTSDVDSQDTREPRRRRLN